MDSPRRTEYTTDFVIIEPFECSILSQFLCVLSTTTHSETLTFHATVVGLSGLCNNSTPLFCRLGIHY